ncbi:MAG: hypothetical protein ACOXZZ_02720 [Sphaerochaetaceae bacterium]
MKLRRSYLNFVIALAILFLVAFAILFTKVYTKWDLVAQKIISSSLDRGSYTLEVGSIDKELFKRIVINDLTIYDNYEKQILSVQQITVDKKLYHLLIPKLFLKNVKVDLKEVDFNIDDSFILYVRDLFGSPSANSKQKIEIAINRSDGIIDYSPFIANINNLYGVFALKGGNIDYGELYLNSIGVDLGESGNVNVNNIRLDSGSGKTEVQYDNLTSLVEDISLNSGKGIIRNLLDQIEIELTKVKGSYNDISALVDYLKVDGSFKSLRELSFSTLINSVTITNLLGEVGFTNTNLNLFLNQQSVNFDINFNDSLNFTLDNQKGRFKNFLVKGEINDPIHTLQINFDNLDLENNQKEFYFDNLKLDSFYLLGIYNTEIDKIIVESSLDFNLDTTLLIEDLKGQTSFDLSFNPLLEVDFANLSITNVKSTPILGIFKGGVSYNKESLKANFDYSLGVNLDVDVNFIDQKGKVDLKLDDFRFYPLKEFMIGPLRNFESIVAPRTSITASMFYNSDLKIETGSLNGQLSLNDFVVNNKPYTIGSTLSGTFDKENLYVNLASLTGEGLRGSYSGIIDRQTLIPEGIFDLADSDSGKNLIKGEFSKIERGLYNYLIESSLFPTLTFDGRLAWKEESLLSSIATLQTATLSYPLHILVDTKELKLTLDSDTLEGSIDFLDQLGYIKGDLRMRNFPLPFFDSSFLKGSIIVDGEIESSFLVTEQTFEIMSSLLSVSGLTFSNDNNWAVDFALDVNNNFLNIFDIKYSDEFGFLEGSVELAKTPLKELLAYDFTNFDLKVDLYDSKSYLKGVVYPDKTESDVSQGLFDISSFEIGRFIKDKKHRTITLKALGYTNFKEKNRLNLDFESEDLKFFLGLEQRELIVENLLFKSGLSNIDLDLVRLESNGQVFIKGLLSLDSLTTWRDGSSLFPFELTTSIGEPKNIGQLISNLTNLTKQTNPIYLSNKKGQFFGLIDIEPMNHQISYDNGLLTVNALNKGALEGFYNFNSGEIDLTAYDNFILPLKVKGTIDKEYINIDFEDLKLTMSYLDAFFLEPIVGFDGGVMVGNGTIIGPFKDPEYWAVFSGPSVEMNTFWTVGESISIKNPVITVSENTATMSATPISVTHTSGRSTKAIGQLEATIEKWGLPHYRLDILEVENPISFWLPLFFSDVNIVAKVQGYFAIEGTPDDETLYGDIVVSDAMVNIGVPTPPAWVVEKFRTSIDMRITTGKNVGFVYPTEESPILQLTLADEQSGQLNVSAPSMATTFSGQLALRSGEIYYVQKNFYVTEGAIKFPPVGTMPLLNLRARLREFDLEGNRYDIYLVLQDDRIDEISPRFESMPPLSTNEILELLGQSIVAPPSVGDSGLHTVVSVATAATDMISRLGLLQGTTISLGFTKIIRESLGLDVFTIRTNLLQNILIEALPNLAGESSVTPLARYLDNTTLYIGKYLFDDIYLQGMLHFREDTLKQGASFFANDLRVDTEVSVEWTNPLATFSFFTQPNQLSVFDFFDTMGFSITKRFDF